MSSLPNDEQTDIIGTRRCWASTSVPLAQINALSDVMLIYHSLRRVESSVDDNICQWTGATSLSVIRIMSQCNTNPTLGGLETALMLCDYHAYIYLSMWAIGNFSEARQTSCLHHIQ